MVEKYKKQNQIYIIGFDTLPETVKYIRQGTIKATVVQEPYEMGYGAVEMMINIIEGKRVDPIIHTNTRIARLEDLPAVGMGEESDVISNQIEVAFIFYCACCSIIFCRLLFYNSSEKLVTEYDDSFERFLLLNDISQRTNLMTEKFACLYFGKATFYLRDHQKKS